MIRLCIYVYITIRVCARVIRGGRRRARAGEVRRFGRSSRAVRGHAAGESYKTDSRPARPASVPPNKTVVFLQTFATQQRSALQFVGDWNVRFIPVQHKQNVTLFITPTRTSHTLHTLPQRTVSRCTRNTSG